MRRHYACLALLIGPLILTACGQKGPLYLPKKQPLSSTASAPQAT